MTITTFLRLSSFDRRNGWGLGLSLACVGLGRLGGGNNKQGENKKREFLVPCSSGSFWGRSSKGSAEFVFWRLTESVGPILAVLV